MGFGPVCPVIVRGYRRVWRGERFRRATAALSAEASWYAPPISYLTNRRPPATPDPVGKALDQVGATIDEPGLRGYFEMHRRRFAFTLDLVERHVLRPSGSRPRLLDVGYFPGHLARAIEVLGGEVTGVSSPGIAYEDPRVHLVDIERERLPFADDEFDGILFTETVEHLPHSPVFALSEMLRVAKAGAPVVVTTPNLVAGSKRLRFLLGRSPMFPMDAYFEDGGRGAPLEHRHNREYTLAELTALMERCGWRIDEKGWFVAYAKWFADRRDWRPDKVALEAAKLAAQTAVAPCRDSLYVVASKPGAPPGGAQQE